VPVKRPQVPASRPVSPSGLKNANTTALKSPVGFSRGVLGHDPWELQEQILDSLWKNRRTAVRSCHSSGKTMISADAVLAWIAQYQEGIAITTAPGWMQVEKLSWGEIRSSAAHSKVAFPTPLLTELKISDKNYAIGISTRESTRFQGFKGTHVLIVLDEAPGVRPEVWEAINGLRAGGIVHILAIGNPTIVGGDFHDAFTTKRDLWKCITISAFDTPNLLDCYIEYDREEPEVGPDGKSRVVMKKVRRGTGHRNLMKMMKDELEESVRPYLCSRVWVREMIEEFGFEHPYVQSRVYGEFPSESEDALVPLSWIERSKYNEKSKQGDGVMAGLDVAGPGEAETSLTVLDNDNVELVKAWPFPDPRGDVIAALEPYESKLKRLNVDSIGVGWGIYLHMCDRYNRDGKTIVYPINVGVAAADKKKFFNAKAEYYWGLRLKFKDGFITGLTDEKTIGQLAAIRYSHLADGKIKIESKDELVKRGVKSPDRAESLMLASARGRNDLFELGMVDDSVDGGQYDYSDGSDEDELTAPSKWRMR